MNARSMGLAAVLLAGLASAGVAAFSPAAQAAPATVVEQPFAAGSADSCRYGQARGILGWWLPPIGGGPRAVDVSGVLVDHPVSPVTTPECPNDGRFSTVLFTAFAGGAQVDAELVRTDDSARTFQLQLAGETRPVVIDTVVVQVCRQFAFAGPPVYCGPKQAFRAPVSL
jgi:hypothetical protein